MINIFRDSLSENAIQSFKKPHDLKPRYSSRTYRKVLRMVVPKAQGRGDNNRNADADAEDIKEVIENAAV